MRKKEKKILIIVLVLLAIAFIVLKPLSIYDTGNIGSWSLGSYNKDTRELTINFQSDITIGTFGALDMYRTGTPKITTEEDCNAIGWNWDINRVSQGLHACYLGNQDWFSDKVLVSAQYDCIHNWEYAGCCNFPNGQINKETATFDGFSLNVNCEKLQSHDDPLITNGLVIIRVPKPYNCGDIWQFDSNYEYQVTSCDIWQYLPEYSYCSNGGWFVYHYNQPELSNMDMSEEVYKLLVNNQSCWDPIITVYRIGNGVCNEINIYSSEKTENDFDSLASCEAELNQCSESELKYYTCEDGSKVSWCDCVNGKWSCITSPENECSTFNINNYLLIGGFVLLVGILSLVYFKTRK